MGQANEKTETKYGGARIGSLTQFYGLRKIGVLGKARAKKGHAHGGDRLQLEERSTLRMGEGSLFWYFHGPYGCIPRLPDHFLPTNPSRPVLLKALYK